MVEPDPRIKPLLGEAFQACQAGQLEAARTLCERILEISPDEADALELLGVVLSQSGELPHAVDLLSRAVLLQPANPAFHSNLGKALMAAGRSSESVSHYYRAVELQPNHGSAQYDLGSALLHDEQPDAAVPTFQQALRLMPEDPAALNNLGNALRQLGQSGAAVDCYRRALKQKPGLTEAHVNLGLALQESGIFDEAGSCLERAIAMAPGDEDAHLNYAVCCLLQGRYDPGWKEYEWRWRLPKKQQRPFARPTWDGSPLAGRNILVYAEQGIGDEIMFASCLPDLLATAGQVVLECEPRLEPLFSRSFPQARVHGGFQNESAQWLESHDGIDLQVACGSLPRRFRARAEDFPRHSGYLTADKRAVEKWRHRYDALGKGLKVGLSWRGGGNALSRMKRTVDLAAWGAILSQQGAVFINVQYGDALDEIAAIKEHSGVIVNNFPDADPLKDMDDFAAQLSALDLVITIDNSTAHLAGALGVPVWVLLHRVPDWRWMMERSDSPWYPEASLIRQSQDEAWDSVIQVTADRLRTLMA